MNTKEIITDIHKAVLYQHIALTKAVSTCQADKFILIQNRINVRNILINLSRLEDRFIFKKNKNFAENTQILVDILMKKGEQ